MDLVLGINMKSPREKAEELVAKAMRLANEVESEAPTMGLSYFTLKITDTLEPILEEIEAARKYFDLRRSCHDRIKAKVDEFPLVFSESDRLRQQADEIDIRNEIVKEVSEAEDAYDALRKKNEGNGK